jgi:hypothetical protein
MLSVRQSHNYAGSQRRIILYETDRRNSGLGLITGFNPAHREHTEEHQSAQNHSQHGRDQQNVADDYGGSVQAVHFLRDKRARSQTLQPTPRRHPGCDGGYAGVAGDGASHPDSGVRLDIVAHVSYRKWVCEAPFQIRNAILLAFGVSLVVFLMRLFVRLATSAYHLSRDAKEREQLTHVFRALVNDKSIEPEDRSIILSAIFSRSDTGLIKGEGAPALPGTLGAVLDMIKGSTH